VHTVTSLWTLHLEQHSPRHLHKSHQWPGSLPGHLLALESSLLWLESVSFFWVPSKVKRSPYL
jgi:hypothetical protein